MPPKKPPMWDCHAVSALRRPVPSMIAIHRAMRGRGPRLCFTPVMPFAFIIMRTAPNRPLIAPEAPTTGVGVAGLMAKYVKSPHSVQKMKKISVMRMPFVRSKKAPMAIIITQFISKCIQLPWIKVVVTGAMAALHIQGSAPV